jgi:hypothetical protein
VHKFVESSLSPLQQDPGRHEEQVGGADRSDPMGVDGGKEAEGEDAGGDGGKVPEELEDAAAAVEILLLGERVPGKERKLCLSSFRCLAQKRELATAEDHLV